MNFAWLMWQGGGNEFDLRELGAVFNYLEHVAVSAQVLFFVKYEDDERGVHQAVDAEAI